MATVDNRPYRPAAAESRYGNRPRGSDACKTSPFYDQSERGSGPSSSQILAVVGLLPIGLTLLAISGITFVATIITLALATPVFVIFSPILVPAALAVAFAVAGFLTSGVFGVAALSSVSWLVSYLRKAARSVGDNVEQQQGKWRMEVLGQKGKDSAGDQGYAADDRAGPRVV